MCCIDRLNRHRKADVYQASANVSFSAYLETRHKTGNLRDRFPFVPGAEIGLAMLAAFGQGIAPLIYVCTVASMTLAYAVGRFLPIGALERLLSFLRMRRAATLVARAAPLSQEERLAMLLEGQSKRSLSFLVRYPYLALALAVNTPGNSVIGGGGGIMIMAGLSGIFSPLSTFLTVALAVSPVPFAVVFLGVRI